MHICGHKFGNDLETGHQHIYLTITYTIIMMLMLYTFTYLVKVLKYFQDFRVAPSCIISNRKLPGQILMIAVGILLEVVIT